MNYEQKYKEALENARWKIEHVDCGDEGCFNIDDIKDIFPELRESEDERIRKEIYRYFRDLQLRSDREFSPSISIDEILAWLEKQGEQKPVEQDTEIHDLWVYIREWNEKFGRLPKDEDELVSCIDYVMKRQKQLSWSEKHIADVFEKVGLAKIVREQGNDQLTNAVQSAMIELSKHQNPAWSEEDEKIYNEIIDFFLGDIETRCATIDKQRHFGYWLKSFKPNHWKPSEG